MNTIIKKVTALLLIITLCVLNMLSQTKALAVGAHSSKTLQNKY
jgi:hypothetical protein